MKPLIRCLPTADTSAWTEAVAESDGLPIRDSGPWIETKHRLLGYYAQMFATGMKNRWASRIYLELFSGPGRCLVRPTNKEEPGSPLKVIDHEFTRFIFTEVRLPAAEALAERLASSPNAARTEIWCGDCAEAIRHIKIPPHSLTFAFIDPTGIGHAPFAMIEALHRKTRCDLLINIQHGMGIKMNLHQYTPDAGEASALTRFLGHDGWKNLPIHNAKTFFLGVLDFYKSGLERMGFAFIGREVLIRNQKNSPLYLLLYASGHERGREFWEKSVRGLPQQEFDFGSS